MVLFGPQPCLAKTEYYFELFGTSPLVLSNLRIRKTIKDHNSRIVTRLVRLTIIKKKSINKCIIKSNKNNSIIITIIIIITILLIIIISITIIIIIVSLSSKI